MARSNGPFGQLGARAPWRRQPADDPFAAPPAAQPNGQWPPAHPDAGHAGQPGQGYHFPPPEPDPNYGYNQQAPAPQQWGPQPDPRGYDLGNYMPAGAQPYPPHPPVDPGQFPQGPHQGHYGGPQQSYAETDADYDEEFLEDDDEPRRGRRWMLIAAALVGAIGVGGALAYTYKSFIAPQGRVPFVKAGDPNVKVKPENRGGKEFPNPDRKMLSRLGEESGQQQTAPAAESQDDRASEEKNLGPRSVKTIPIVPGGGPPAAQVAPPPTVPGIMLENMGPRTQPAPQPPPRTATAPPPPPGRVTLGQPPPPPAQTEDAAPPARRPPVQVPPVTARPPPVKAKEAPAPVATASTGAGFVAVLSSQKSHIDALKAFADIQQKYGEVLAGKTPAVQEANLGEKGIWYRAVVGPPGSRDAANGVCSQLKSAGYSNCWVNAY